MKTIGEFLKEMFAAWKKCVVEVYRAYSENWLARILIVTPVVALLSFLLLWSITVGAVTMSISELKHFVTMNYRIRKKIITMRKSL